MVDMCMGGSVVSLSALHQQVGVENALLEVRDLRKEYVTGRGRLRLFDGLSFTVRKGELLAIVGASGAGKSTLLHILGALDAPTSGALYFASIPLNKLNPRQAADFRTGKLATSGSFTTCCLSSRRQRMSRCPCWPAASPAKTLKLKHLPGWMKSAWRTGRNTRRESSPAANSRGCRWRGLW